MVVLTLRHEQDHTDMVIHTIAISIARSDATVAGEVTER